MLFSSMTFIFIFLPLVCITYFLARNDIHNFLLLIASIVFYAWGEPNYLVIMLSTILINYWGARFLDTHRQKAKLILTVTILLDLSFLFYFKYFDFVIENINYLTSANLPLHKIIMPIGISFYTFQAISYLIDVYRKQIPAQKDIYKLALYIAFFPQLVAGPIVKYHDVAEQINHRSVTFEKVSLGIKRFIVGLAKKILIANTMGAIADKIFIQPVEQFDTFVSWLGAIAYSLQLYYDFSGYSDMAIGLGLIFGFQFLENFNYPYISKSITEFWRRWHISLSTWFKEYLYIPLGGNRISVQRTYINLFIVFLATGIWHGASWNFVIWGLWHGAFIIFEKASGWHKKLGNLRLNIAHHIYTILVFVIGWVMFRADSMSYACDYIKNMFGFVEATKEYYRLSYYVDRIELLTFIAAIICAMPLFSKILYISFSHKIKRAVINIWLAVLFILSVSSIAASTYNPFIYFRF